MPKRRGRTSAAQTIAPNSDKISGSTKNKAGSATNKGSSQINLSDKTINALKEKLENFKKENPSKKNVDLNDLKAVYRRGSGAYSKSHRPTITGGAPNSRAAWSYARVNKFLKKASGEKVKAAYVQDDDLMEKGGEVKNEIILIRGEGKNTTGTVDLFGRGLYLTDSLDVAKFYGNHIKTFKIKGKIYDTEKPMLSREFRKFCKIFDTTFNTNLGNKLLQGLIDYNDGKLPLETYTYQSISWSFDSWYEFYELLKKEKLNINQELSYANTNTAINMALKNMGYVGLKYSTDEIEDLEEKGLGGLNAFLIFDKNSIQVYEAENIDKKYEDGGDLGQEITCMGCGWSWNTNQSDEHDKYICHKCGFDNRIFYDSDPIGYADGGLLAPNLKPSNLTPQQYKLVRTPEFKAWFGDWENDPKNASKVVDSNGEPKVVFHGTSGDWWKEYFVFNPAYEGQKHTVSRRMAKGMYFTSSIKVAKEYIDDDGQIFSFFLNFRNPILFDMKGEDLNNLDLNSTNFNDDVIIKNTLDTRNNHDFEREQYISDIYLTSKTFGAIKLADGTNTMFDSNNPDVRYNDGGELKDKIFMNENGGETIKAAKGKKIDAKGDCYYIAGQFAMHKMFAPAQIDFIGEPYLVHAEVKGQGKIEGLRYGHAWIEDDENVYDYSNGRQIKLPKMIYYMIGDIRTDNPKKYQKYTFSEARKKMVDTGTYGSWDIDTLYEEGGTLYKEGGLTEGEADKVEPEIDTNMQEVLKETESLKEISIKHGVTMQYLEEQLKIGSDHEKEHFKSEKEVGSEVLQKVAEVIALHHLAERPDYYEKLAELELEDGDILEEKEEEEPIPVEIVDFLASQKMEAEQVLMCSDSRLFKTMICRAKIDLSEQRCNDCENPEEKIAWNECKNIWQYCMNDILENNIPSFKKGGIPCGCGTMYEKGGLAYGNSHDKGGMPLKVSSTGQNIEIEGGEGVVNKRSMQMNKKLNFEGQKMTPCEVISKINQMGGGVKFKCADVENIIAEDGNF